MEALSFVEQKSLFDLPRDFFHKDNAISFFDGRKESLASEIIRPEKNTPRLGTFRLDLLAELLQSLNREKIRSCAADVIFSLILLKITMLTSNQSGTSIINVSYLTLD